MKYRAASGNASTWRQSSLSLFLSLSLPHQTRRPETSARIQVLHTHTHCLFPSRWAASGDACTRTTTQSFRALSRTSSTEGQLTEATASPRKLAHTRRLGESAAQGPQLTYSRVTVTHSLSHSLCFAHALLHYLSLSLTLTLFRARTITAAGVRCSPRERKLDLGRNRCKGGEREASRPRSPADSTS